MRMIHHHIECQAKAFPQGIAVIDGNKTILYDSLNRLANSFATYLLSLGIGSGDYVPILCDKSAEAIVAMLGILKAGAAFVPLNVCQPDAALRDILRAIDAKLLCVGDVNSWSPSEEVKLFSLPDMQEILADVSDADLHPNLSSLDDHDAYLIFTSGTTGAPKGVAITHGNLTVTYDSWLQVYQLSSSDCHIQMANLAFDVFIGDWVRALCSGGTLVLCHHDTLVRPKELHALIHQYDITVGEFVPSTLRALVHYCQQEGLDLAPFRLLICGSDTWTMSEYRLAKSLCCGGRVINSYGLTEATIDSGFFEEVSLSLLPDSLPVPIGKPFQHAHFWVLDENLEAVPLGEPGDLYISGPGLSKGYFHRDDLTEASFKCMPDRPDLRIYRTGDKVCIMPDGQFSFLGRGNWFIKVDGHKVELPVVESILTSHPDIDFAMTSLTLIGSKSLLTAFVSLRNQGMSFDKLLDFMAEKLPAYAIPKAVYLIDGALFTDNGKIDRHAICQQTDVPMLSEDSLPVGELESKIVALWQSILGRKEISTRRDFCELGGNSIEFVDMITRLSDEFGVTIPHNCGLSTIDSIKKYIATSNMRTAR